MIFNTEYFHAPKHEIEQTISWLESVKTDCDLKIRKLRAMKAANDRSRRHVSNVKHMAREFATTDFLTIDPDNQAEIIRQRLGCSYHRANLMRDAAVRLVKKQSRKNRDIKIARLYDAGEPITTIAQAVDVSRQTVHTVLKKHKEKPII